MNGILMFLAIVLSIAIMVFAPSLSVHYEAGFGTIPPVTVGDCARALVFCYVLAAVAGFLIRRIPTHGSYLFKLFAFALLLRIVIGTAILVLNGQDFFGGDAFTYDYYGYQQVLAWGGDANARSIAEMYIGPGIGIGSAWGMVYAVAVIYGIIGRNLLAIQFVNAVLGAATAPVIFMCAHEVFKNRRVAKLAALAVAFYPSLVLWSSQGLKDGPIIFSLALCMLATLKLGQKLSGAYIAVLVAGLLCILGLRFYVFYMIMAAIVGAFLIGMRAATAQSIVRQFVIFLVLGLSMTYLGVTRLASSQFEQYGSLQELQRSRLDATRSAETGFNKDVDVSTTSGALSTIPKGLLYLLFAPFPWDVGSLRQNLTLPEMAIWWASFPLLVLGLWFSIKYRLRQMSPILIFTSMLSVAYSVFQGNVGTAYRQRAQLLVFYFIFVAVGVILLKEKREEKARLAKRERLIGSQRRPAWANREPKPQVVRATLEG